MANNLLQKFRTRRATLAAESEALRTTAEAENRGLTDEEKQRDDAMYAEITTLDADIAREERHHEWARTAPPVATYSGDGRPLEPATNMAPVETAPPVPGGRRPWIHDGRDLSMDMPWGWSSYGMTATQFAAAHPGTGTLPRLDPRHPLARYEMTAFGEMLQAVYRAQTDQGIDRRLSYFSAAQGAGQVIGPDGGFLLRTTEQDAIKLRMAGGQILSRVRPIPLDDGSDSLKINVVDETSRVAGSRHGGVRGYWVSEGTAPTATRPKFREYTLSVHGLGAFGYATNNLLRNVSALGAMMLPAFSDELRFLTEDAIVNGTGAGMPSGLLIAGGLISLAKESNQAAATVVYENLPKMWSRLLVELRANAVWLIHSDVEPQLDQLSLTAGTGALEPRFIGYSREGVLTIKGRPVVSVEYCATLGTVGDIVLTNFDDYGFIEVPIEQASSMHVAFSTNEMAFRVMYYVDGAPFQKTALTPFKGSTTQSSVVALATRS